MIALLAAALAASPEAVEAPPGVTIEVGRDGETWTVVVGDRRTTVPAPADEVALAAFRALLTSLLADVGPEAPDPAVERALALVGTPPPPRAPPVPAPLPAELPPELLPEVVIERTIEPPPAPLVPLLPSGPPTPLVDLDGFVAPPPERVRWSASARGELVVRAGLQPAVGLGAAIEPVGAAGVRLGVSLRAPRPIPGTVDARLGEVLGELVGRVAPWGWLDLSGGPAVAGRRWRDADGIAATHVVPVAVAAVSARLRVGAVRVAPSVGGEVDLGRTELTVTGAHRTLSPLSLRVAIALSREPDRPDPTSSR